MSENERRKQGIGDQLKLLYANDPNKLEALLGILEGCRSAEQLNDFLDRISKPQKTETTVIDEKDITNHLNHGWEFVGTTPSGKCIIRRPL